MRRPVFEKPPSSSPPLKHYRHCEERPVRRSSMSEGGSDEAIQLSLVPRWIASRSLSSGAHSRDPLARNDDLNTIVRNLSRILRQLHDFPAPHPRNASFE